MNEIFIPTEDEEQAMLFSWAALESSVRPELKFLFAIPNGGYRSKVTAARMKHTGTKSGVPDIMLPVARHGAHGLFIELKRLKGGRLSVNQTIWLEELSRQGYRCAVCHGFDEAMKEILDYLS